LIWVVYTGGDDVHKLYFILIGSVFILSILFAIIIWRQTIKFEKKALAAKKAKEEYLNQLMLEQEEERRLAELRLEEELQQKLQEELLENTDAENNPETKPEYHKE
jgi:flagellar biosynthesis/type III secretory pathway M-ring protein FliF/YscJ